MIKKSLKIIMIVLILIGIGITIFVEQKNPKRSGSLKINNLTATVTVDYDNFGVPHIFAKNDSDLYRALGYVHAQDRLFQMELLRRLSQGKLSEILGKKLLGADKLFLTLGIHKYAKNWVATAEKKKDNPLLKIMDAYLDGVNQFVDQGPKPLEFNLLNIPPHHYNRVDIASIMGYMSFSFAQALRDDPLVTRLAQTFPASYLKQTI